MNKNGLHRKVSTKDNTSFIFWWAGAIKAFEERGLKDPTFGPAHDAYEMGEAPETWADYVRFDPTWQK